MGDLDNKTIIVAGAGPGLGRETALASFRQGANVVIAARTARFEHMAMSSPPPWQIPLTAETTGLTLCRRSARSWPPGGRR